MSFAYAAVDRFADWKAERLRRRAAKDLEKKRAAAANAKPVVTAQLVPRRAAEPVPATPVAEEVLAPPPPAVAPVRTENVRSGIEREFEAAAPTLRPVAVPKQVAPLETEGSPAEPIAVGSRADSVPRGKTTMPRIAGGYKLPSTALLHRADEHSAVNEEELKNLAGRASGEVRRV